jgi:PAS domain S-box-containing protein
VTSRLDPPLAAVVDLTGAPLPVLSETVRRSRVLVVDDNPANVLLIQRLLRAADLADVEGCTDSGRALELCRASMPDLLFLDLHMPHPDGFEILEMLRSVLVPDVLLPVIVLTADVGTDVKRRALALGAKDFLTKPLDNVEVVLRARNLLEWAHLVRRLGEAAASQGRAVARERALRRAATALGVDAVDRDTVLAVARDAIAALTAGDADVAIHLGTGLAADSSSINIPLAAGGATYGKIVISGAYRMPEEVLDALQTLAAQVALALEAAALSDDLRRREQQEAAAVLVQQSSDVIAVIDGDLVIRYLTPSVEAVLGYAPAVLIGTRLPALMTSSGDAAEAHYASVSRTAGAGPPVEWELHRADGTEVPVQAMSNNLLADPRVRGIVVTLRDIRERRAFERGLVRQVKELQELDRMKDDLVSTVSHELRTPLTSILGHTEMLADGVAGPMNAEQAHVVGVIDRNGHRLLALIEDLLTLGRVESQGMQINLAPTALPPLIAAVRDSLRQTASARGQTLLVDIAPGVDEIIADASLLSRALTNLLSNAVKFTPAGGTVRLTVELAGGDALFVVSDTGMGISVEDQRRLFTRFFRSSVATLNAIPGTGLGLSIVKQIVDAHRGQIQVESAVGAGTKVAFTIPGRRAVV